MDALRFRLDRAKTAVLIVDLQEKLGQAMDAAKLARVVNRARALIEGAKALSLPVVVTEQYPKGLGPTIAELRAALPEGTHAVEKIDFPAMLPAVVELLGGRKQVLLCGMEAHVCVFQTARDLLEKGGVPFVCSDGVLSRNEEDLRCGLERARDLGAVITTVEAALFDLVGKAGTPEFKKVSAAVK